jgi:tRNA nucleotidyltransferase/poly(A) polymerase
MDLAAEYEFTGGVQGSVCWNRAMQVYLVGGAVRDEQPGLPIKKRDWCVATV